MGYKTFSQGLADAVAPVALPCPFTSEEGEGEHEGVIHRSVGETCSCRYPSGITANVAGALEGEQMGDGVGVPVVIRVRLPEVRMPVFCRYCHWVVGAVLGIIPISGPEHHLPRRRGQRVEGGE